MWQQFMTLSKRSLKLLKRLPGRAAASIVASTYTGTRPRVSSQPATTVNASGIVHTAGNASSSVCQPDDGGPNTVTSTG